MMGDRYLSINESIRRLRKDLEAYGKLFIAFDFDGTVFDYFNEGDTYPRMEFLLRMAKRLGHVLILFTAQDTQEKVDKAVAYCKAHGYEPTYVNENPIMNSRKPYYNILLDDRAGLRESYEILKNVLNV